MGPVLENRGLTLQQMCQLLLFVGMVAGKQDHVMCPFDRCYTVDLHEPQACDRLQKPRSGHSRPETAAQAVTRQKKPTGRAVLYSHRGQRLLVSVGGSKDNSPLEGREMPATSQHPADVTRKGVSLNCSNYSTSLTA